MSTTQLHTALLRSLEAVRRQQQLCLHAARTLESADLHVIAHAFRFTARQEGEQAAILSGLIEKAPAPSPAGPEGGDAAALLRAAIAREESCLHDLLPAAVTAAQAAGSSRIAAALTGLCGNEERHMGRFRRYLSALEEGSLFDEGVPVSWFCLRCGCLHRGSGAPGSCEGCGASRGHFIRSGFQPFSA